MLDTIDVGRDQELKDLRLPVQYVNRPDATFRGYSGTIAAGSVAVGDPVMAVPSRRMSKVREIIRFDGNLQKAGADMAVTLALEDELDISRGDLLVHPDRSPSVSRIFDAHLIWMSDSPLLPGRQYEFKLSHRYLRGTVESIQHRIDVNDLSEHAATELKLNEVGLCRIVLAEQAAFDTYGTCRSTGALIVVDRLTHATAGAGMILRSAAPQGSSRTSRSTGSRPRSATSSAPTRRPSGPASCGSPACPALASPRSRTRSSSRSSCAGTTATCWTATTSAMASTRTSTSAMLAASRTSVASARSRSSSWTRGSSS